MRIFRPPLRATVTLQEGRPARIACPRRKEISGEILWAAGPWRTSGDWWEQEGWARDEWDIALQEEPASHSIAWSAIYSADSGRWREAMTESPDVRPRTSDIRPRAQISGASLRSNIRRAKARGPKSGLK